MMPPEIANLFEELIIKFGDTPQGIGWEGINQEKIRSQAAFDVFKHEINPTILDFGCGPARFLDFIKSKNFQCIFSGVDSNLKSIEMAKTKYPDVIFQHSELPIPAQYIVANGVFTAKMDMSNEEMWKYTSENLIRLWEMCEKAIIFNFHTPLMHWSSKAFAPEFDVVLKFVITITTKFVIKHEYLLTDYFVIMYK
jgi:SAM-dependent methyltransferase